MLKLAFIASGIGLFLMLQAYAQVDPRLVGPTIQALTAQIAFLQAASKVQQEEVAAEHEEAALPMRSYRWATNPLWRLK